MLPPSQPWNVIVGQAIRAWRRNQRPRLTQQRLAEVLGIPANTVSMIEKGLRALSLEESVRLRQFYGFSIEERFSVVRENEGPWMDLVSRLSPEEQAEVYDVMYRMVQMLLRAKTTGRQRKTGERPPRVETPSDNPGRG